MPTFDHGAADIPALAITIPILVACLLVAFGRRIPRPVVDSVALAAALTVLGLLAALLASSSHGRVVSWTARWVPEHGYSVGIVLVADPVGAGVAVLAAALVALALLYSWHYLSSVSGHFHALMLLFLAGMVGFALTGDLFNMFVFFELMGASAYALTGMKIEDPTAVQGALNFGIINSLGAYVSLSGVALLYARVGNLSLPQLSAALAGHRPDALLIAGFVAVSTGFLVKGALAPFHFWLADAHAVAPAPVCVLFSGVMVPLGLYGALRVYWIVFARVFPHGEIRRAFLVLGVLTALVGAVMCFGQRHFKRLLAYSTIAHVGLFVVAAGLLSASGTAGALLYIAGHAGVKAALFLLGGVMLDRYGGVDEVELWGRGRDARVIPWLFVAGGIALAGLPPFGTGLGKAVSEEAGSHAGYGWFPVLFVAVSAITGGAVLRATGRVYFGLGADPRSRAHGSETSGSHERSDVDQPLRRVPLTMLVPIVGLLLGALAVGVLPGAHTAAEYAAGYFLDSGGYTAQALGSAGHVLHQTPLPNWTGLGVGLGLLSAALALAIAAVALYPPKLRVGERTTRVARAPIIALHRIHSGHVGDYVAWMFVGIAALSALVALPLQR
ncbi:MAG TPA: complex I subunit 5 family protein [Mycobacteriales bacterium]|nr:complex I subunit 5 family protein [Mycobacteriales bacterium]